MIDVVAFLKTNLAEHFGVYFIPLYVLGGRPVAILSAQFLGYKIFFLLPLVVLLDTLQIPIFYHLYDTISNRLLVRKFQEKSGEKEQRLRKSKLFNWAQVMGIPGVLVITMLPLKGCGMWSGVLLSKLLKLPKITAYLLLISGSIIGCSIVFGLGEAVLELWSFF